MNLAGYAAWQYIASGKVENDRLQAFLGDTAAVGGDDLYPCHQASGIRRHHRQTAEQQAREHHHPGRVVRDF